MANTQIVRGPGRHPKPPRLEAVELSQALGIEDFSYSERDAPTFQGVYKGRRVIVKKRIASYRRASTRKAWHEAVGRLARITQVPKQGQSLTHGWVVVTVVETSRDAGLDTARAQSTPSITLEQAIAEQGGEVRLRGAPASPRAASFAEAEVAQASMRGHRYLLTLIESGSLISSRDMAEAWHISPQNLGQCRSRGEVVGLKINNRLWYPEALKHFLTREDAQRVCLKLRGLPAIEQVLVLTHPHDALGGRTIAQAMAANQREVVDRLLDRIVESE